MQSKFIVMALLLAPAIAGAQGAFQVPQSQQRAEYWDFSLQAVFQNSESSRGPNGSSTDIDDEVGFGLAFAYNFTDHVALGIDMNWISPRYTAVLVPDDGSPAQTISHKADILNFQLKGIYNLLDGPLTPYVEGSAGWTYVDSNVASSPPITGCWWDPWWGYICSTFWNTYSSTDFSYGGGVGLRWEFGGNMFVRGSYNILLVDAGRDEASLDGIRVEFGWRY